jgi:hypothetical protein
MPKPRRRLPKGIQVRKNGTLLICYKNEFGKIMRENTRQSDVKAAELMLAQARTDVAMKKRFTALSFESVKFIDLFKRLVDQPREPYSKQIPIQNTPRDRPVWEE